MGTICLISMKAMLLLVALGPLLIVSRRSATRTWTCVVQPRIHQLGLGTSLVMTGTASAKML